MWDAFSVHLHANFPLSTSNSLSLVDPVPLMHILSNGEMAMGLGFISEFHISIERHLNESKKIWIETGSRTAPTPGTSAKIAFQGMAMDYLGALEDLRDKISGRSASVNFEVRLTE